MPHYNHAFINLLSGKYARLQRPIYKLWKQRLQSQASKPGCFVPQPNWCNPQYGKIETNNMSGHDCETESRYPPYSTGQIQNRKCCRVTNIYCNTPRHLQMQLRITYGLGLPMTFIPLTGKELQVLLHIQSPHSLIPSGHSTLTHSRPIQHPDCWDMMWKTGDWNQWCRQKHCSLQ